jgi:hypothetical protein
VTAGVLPGRDEHLGDLERWLARTLATLDPDRQRLIRAFVTWHHLGRLRRRLRGKPASAHQVTSVRASVRAALGLLRWLDARQPTLASCRQADLDRWIADGPSTRYQAHTFLQWTVQRGDAADVEIPDPARRTQTQLLAAEHRWTLARRLLNDPTIATADRIAGLFILLYAQPISAIARLRTDRITTHDAGVHVLFGDTRLLLLDPSPSWSLSSSSLGTATPSSAATIRRRGCFPAPTPASTSARATSAAASRGWGSTPIPAAMPPCSTCPPSSPQPSCHDCWVSAPPPPTAGPAGPATPGPATQPRSSGAITPGAVLSGIDEP